MFRPFEFTGNVFAYAMHNRFAYRRSITLTLYGYYLWLTQYFMSPPGLYPLSATHGGKNRTSAKTEMTPPILGSGSSNMLEFFWLRPPIKYAHQNAHAHTHKVCVSLTIGNRQPRHIERGGLPRFGNAEPRHIEKGGLPRFGNAEKFKPKCGGYTRAQELCNYKIPRTFKVYPP